MILRNKRRLLSFISLPDDWWLAPALKWLLLIFLAFTLQTQITVFETPFNFIILIVYMFALQAHIRGEKGEFSSWIWEIKCTLFGVSVGILDDIISGSIIGPSFFSKGLIGFLIAVLFGSIFFRWTPLLGIIVVFIMTIFDGFVQIVIRLTFTEIKIDFLDASITIIMQALINLLLGLLLRPPERG